jgi:hypothetical protein
MASGTPPYQQLQALLYFLKGALETDTVLLTYLDAQEIVSSTLEHPPFEERQPPAQAGVQLPSYVHVYDTELPAICCWEESSKPVRGSRPAWGEEAKLTLLYIFRLWQGSSTVSPQAWGQRISKLVYWRMCYYLHMTKPVFTDSGSPYYLLTEGNIHSLGVGDAWRLSHADYEGFATELTMVHYAPPYSEAAPPLLDYVEFDIYEPTTDDGEDPRGYLTVSGKVDTDGS